MTYKLTAVITHKSFDAPVIKEIYFTGESLDDVLAQIESTGTPANNIYNLRKHSRTAFKDTRGVKHKWQLKLMEEMN